ncbi:MAG TPA: hypothetical protein VIM42_11590 [Clostridium sp.]
MPRIRKTTVRNQNAKLNKRVRVKLIKAKINTGGVKVINTLEKKDVVTYSTPHILDREANDKIIQNLLKRHSKLLKRLAE